MMTSYASDKEKQFCSLWSSSFRHWIVHVCILIYQKHLFKHRANTVIMLHL